MSTAPACRRRRPPLATLHTPTPSLLLLVALLLLGQAAPRHATPPTPPTQLVVQQLLLSLHRLTVGSWNSSAPWAGWPATSPDCDNNNCLRYQVSAAAYAAAAAALATPAHVAVAAAVLENCVLRLVAPESWAYVADFAEFRRQPSFPDPVAFKNVMYSGHLAQVLLLYEAVSGDRRFNTSGFDFLLNASSTPIHHTRASVLAAARTQIGRFGGQRALGGIPCEPDSIFIICNNFLHSSLRLADVLDGTARAPPLAAQWQATLHRHARSLAPDHAFLNLDYLIVPGLWEPVSSVGADAWAAAFLDVWWPEEGENESGDIDVIPQTLPAALAAALRHSAGWEHTTLSPTQCPTNPGLSSVLRVNVSVLGSHLFPFNDDVTTSLVPLIEKMHVREHTDAVLRHFECTAGQLVDACAPGDAVLPPAAAPRCPAYIYNVSGGYRVFASANLLLGLALSDRAAMLSLFRNHPTPHEALQGGPYLLSAPYPHCLVTTAARRNASGNVVLALELHLGDRAQAAVRPHLVVANVPADAALQVLVDGRPGLADIVRMPANASAQILPPPLPATGMAMKLDVIVGDG